MNLIGIMWGKNEGDILAEVIEAALPLVDSLYIVDDDSTDASWSIIESYRTKLGYAMQRQHAPKHQYHPRLWGRQHLLDVVRSRFKPEDTWVQVIESDMMLLETDPREAIAKFPCSDVAVFWHMLNAYRKPGDWGPEVDKWPNWDRPIKEVMPLAHFIETMLYTFRPVPEIVYTELKPWPRGFGKYNLREEHPRQEHSPLLAHYGYRGPTHFFSKQQGAKQHSKYRNWIFESPATVLSTVSLFNGQWNKRLYPMSREGWKSWVNRHESPISTP